jgi:hypothetical protein
MSQRWYSKLHSCETSRTTLAASPRDRGGRGGAPPHGWAPRHKRAHGLDGQGRILVSFGRGHGEGPGELFGPIGLAGCRFSAVWDPSCSKAWDPWLLVPHVTGFTAERRLGELGCTTEWGREATPFLAESGGDGQGRGPTRLVEPEFGPGHISLSLSSAIFRLRGGGLIRGHPIPSAVR